MRAERGRQEKKEAAAEMELRGMKPTRSSGKPENRKLGNFLIVSCTILSLCILSLVKAHYCPAPYVESPAALKLKVSEKAVTEENVEQPPFQDDEDDEDDGDGGSPKRETPKSKPVCYESGSRSDTCEAEGDIRVQGRSRTVFMVNGTPATSREWKTKPYARKSDAAALARVGEWTLKPGAEAAPRCTVNHTAPAVVFSIGGYTGNLFHDFTDVLVPLYITARRFRGDVHLLASDVKPWWLRRFGRILSQLSRHEVVVTDGEEESASGAVVRCFPRVIVGPTFDRELGVEAGREGNVSMSDFKGMVRAAMGLERERAMTGTSASMRKARLLIISRRRTRGFVNEKGMAAVAASVGMDVRVGEAEAGTDAARFARLVNSADVLVGVHGAGLTNMVYLPEGAVAVQVVPLGGLEAVARRSFGEPAGGMGVGYLEYAVSEEESTLVEVYGRDHPVIRDPMSVHRQGWGRLKEVYLDGQNVRLHLGRLRSTLLDAIKILPPFHHH